MFQTIKSAVSLADVIAKDIGVSFRPVGENLTIEDEKEHGGCPFCGHNDCFRIKQDDVDFSNSFFKCFSCGEHGDVVTWREKKRKISAREAVIELAREYNVQLPRKDSPIQEVFDLATRYYEGCLWDNEVVKLKELGNLSPVEYQTEVRKHLPETLRKFRVGWSDGGLVDFLRSLGLEDEILIESGLMNKKTKRDYLPSKCFIYPHFVNGKASHFTFKDPAKRLEYQIPKRFQLNGYTFYNQDSIKAATTVILVEGENDLLSCSESGKAPAILATIGQLSSDQLEWMRENLSGKRVLTIFDPDDAGNKYRVKVEKNRRYFSNLAHVLPPNGKDIDDNLKDGEDFTALVTGNIVTVEIIEETRPEPVAVEVPWGSQDIPQDTPVSKRLAEEASDPDDVEIEVVDPNSVGKAKKSSSDNKFYEDVYEKDNAYWKVRQKDDGPVSVKISNFVIKLLNIYKTEKADIEREVIMIKENGKSSGIIRIDSSSKVDLKSFKVMAASAADAFFRGQADDLAKVWEIVYAQNPQTEINIPRFIGRHEEYKAWIFKNVLISDAGGVAYPDENGVFWLHGRSIGIKPESLDVSSSSGDDIPSLVTDLSKEEADELLKGIVENVGKNINSLGKALLATGWGYASVYSNVIFEANKGFPFLFFWGTHGNGKSTVSKWITQHFFGVNEHGSTSVPNLYSGRGWARKAEYYASIPLFIDEVRSNEETKQFYGVFRSYYDRESRTMGIKEDFGIRTQRPRAVFVFNGEDQFEDPATRERCIPIRIPSKDRETAVTYQWMEEHKHLFTGVLFHWILEFGEVMRSSEKKAAMLSEIKALDRILLSSGCSQRIAKNWAAVGYFGKRIADQFFPDFDFTKFLVESCVAESNYQKTDTTLSQFWDAVEGCMAQEMPKITDRHITRSGSMLYVWWSPVFKIIQDEFRGRFPFSKNAVLSALSEEPYFICKDKKVSMGVEGVRRNVIALDLTKAPDAVRNIAQCWTEVGVE